jgi:uncharacterized protein YutE (UPF0331/DUF86 family)/broad-specificity NMP kinase
MERIDQKIEEIQRFLEELESVLPIDFEDYKTDWKTRDICERHFEKIIEGATDLAFLVINKLQLKNPESDKQAFEILSQENIISEELSQRLKDAKGMRNIIAHEYGRIDDELVFEAVTQEISKDAKEFLNKIENNMHPFVIIIRGILGIGKITIAKMLTKDLGADYFSIDSILEQEGLDKVDEKQGCIPLSNFIKANEKILLKIKETICLNKTVIIDGNFYHKEQLDNLVNSLSDSKVYIFTLKTSLKTCIQRDKERQNSYGKDAATAVYKLVSRFDYGIIIDTENKTEKVVVEEIKEGLK